MAHLTRAKTAIGLAVNAGQILIDVQTPNGAKRLRIQTVCVT